jgi:hypothetical protein
MTNWRPSIGTSRGSTAPFRSKLVTFRRTLVGLRAHVTLIEPAGYATDWGGPSAKRAKEMPAYQGARDAIAAFRGRNNPGDPRATGPAILRIVDAQQPPLRVFFGSAGLPMTRTEYGKRLENWEKWNDVAVPRRWLAAKRAR